MARSNPFKLVHLRVRKRIRAVIFNLVNTCIDDGPEGFLFLRSRFRLDSGPASQSELGTSGPEDDPLHILDRELHIVSYLRRRNPVLLHKRSTS